MPPDFDPVQVPITAEPPVITRQVQAHGRINLGGKTFSSTAATPVRPSPSLPMASRTLRWSTALWVGTNQQLVRISDDGQTLDKTVVAWVDVR